MSAKIGGWKLYFFFVLLPQFLWFFSTDSHTAANCEGCSFSPLFHGSVSGMKSEGERSDGETVSSNGCEHSYDDDKLTATMCSCSYENESETSESSFFLDEHGGW